MQKKFLSLFSAAALLCVTLIGCGSVESTADTEDETSESATVASYADETVYGQVTAVSDTGFTMTVGTYDESTGELTLSEDTTDVTVSDSTTYSFNMSMGDQSGEAPSGDAPEMPSGDASSDGTAPSGDGQAPSGDGQAPSDEGQAPSGDAPSGDAQASGDAPEKPADDSTTGDASADASAPSGDAPEAPSGDASADGAAPSGDAMTASLESISEGTQVAVTFDADGNVTSVEILGGGNDSAMGGPGGTPGGSQSADITYSALNEISSDETVDGESITSTGTDENAYLITDGNVTIKNTDITKKSDDSTGGDNSSFYGVGATILTTGGTAYIDNVTIDSDAKGGAGVFAYGDGVVYVADSTITTQQSTSGGIHAAGGGTLYAWDNTVTTNGESAAAIRSDRGGGTMVVDGGTYTSNGTGSPAIYCTADIAVNDATLTATNSEAICIEGLNSLHLYNCDLSGAIPDDSRNDVNWNVILYQSMSGDSEVGNSTFSMDGGTLTAENGGMFYTTNTESTFILKNVDITYADENDFFLRCTGNANERGWGTSGANGADCTFTAIEQEMEGDIVYDSISNLDFYMTDGSTLTGAVIDDESAAGNGGDGYCNLYISSDSTWVVTGDSVLTNLYNAGKIVDENGKTVTVKGTDGTVYVKGDSSYTVTVDSYSDSADLTGAGTTGSFSDYEVEKPSEL